MAIREIAATKEWCCDLCKLTEIMPSRPSYWANLHIQQDAYDYQGAAVADGSIKRLLCSKCREAVVAAINAVKPERKP